MMLLALDLAPTVVAIGVGVLVAASMPPPPSGTILKATWVANAAFLVLNSGVLVGKLLHGFS
jgi:hypothetical protein